MKFSQFEIAAEPGVKRAGIAHEGRFYETDGVNPIAVHEPMDVRLLTPINRPWSVRFFAPGELDFVYANPHSMFGPSESLELLAGVDNVVVVPCLGFVAQHSGGLLSPREADDVILGLTLVNSFRTVEPGARAYDLGFSVGPVITTPDDFDDSVTVDAKGRRYRTTVTLRMNSVETKTLNLADLAFNPAELVAYASLTCNVREGDLLAVELTEPLPIERKDEFSVLAEKIGALTNRLV